MFDEKGAVITTLAVFGGIVFAGFVGYKILKKKKFFQNFKENYKNCTNNIKQAFLEGYRGSKGLKTA